MKIIQLTDSHLFAHDHQEMMGIKTNLKFNEVIQKLIETDLSDTDALFLTGDLSQDDTIESYRKIAETLADFNIPIYWIPGNHDNLANMEEVFGQRRHFIYTKTATLENWHFIFLDTQWSNNAKGYLSEPQQHLLRNELQLAPTDKNIAIVMHHHPIVVNTPLIDNYILENKQDFWNIVTDSKVSLIICGHVDGNYQIKYKSVILESGPATCMQWQKGTTQLIQDNRIGYKIYYFNHSGYSTKSHLW